MTFDYGCCAREYLLFICTHIQTSLNISLRANDKKKAYLISGALLYYDKCGGIQIEITNLLSL